MFTTRQYCSRGRARPGHRPVGRPHPRGGTPTRARGDRQL